MISVQQIDHELISLKPESIQSITMLMELGVKIASWIAFTGQEMANAKKQLLVAKKQAYHAAMADLKKQGKEVAPSLVKDYVSTMCSEQEGYYLLCDRTNAAATHTLTFLNVCLSCLKEEMKAINYNN